MITVQDLKQKTTTELMTLGKKYKVGNCNKMPKDQLINEIIKAVKKEEKSKQTTEMLKSAWTKGSAK